MEVKLHTYLTFPEWREKNEWGLAHGYYNTDPRLFTPGTVWEQAFVFDPTGYLTGTNIRVMFTAEDRGRLGYLGQYYWNDWADIRPPLACMAPSGESFELDRRSVQSEAGWKVTNANPGSLLIHCTPSFVLTHWHGFLHNGVLTKDCEGRDATAYYNKYVKTLDESRPISPENRRTQEWLKLKD